MFNRCPGKCFAFRTTYEVFFEHQPVALVTPVFLEDSNTFNDVSE